jgi:transposase
MNYIGLDFHKYTSYITRLDEKGKVMSQFEMKNTAENIKSFSQSLQPGDHLAVEATGHWMYLYEQLEDSEAEFVLSHPKATKAIASARLKNDKVDSKMLADLLRTDLLPRAYIPPRQIRDLREVLRLRAALIHIRTSVKIRLRGILLKTGNDCPHADILSKSGLIYCREVEVRECYRLALNHWTKVGEDLSRQLDQMDRELKKRAKSNPEAELLMTIPGIGLYSALLILSEIGEISRFTYSDQLVSWAGLAPHIKKSSMHISRGPITKQGSKYLRWILVEAVYNAVRGSKRFRSKYESVVARRGKNKARTAVAAMMLRSIHWMLVHKEPFKDVE